MSAASTEGLAPGLVADDLPAPTVQCHAANLMPLADGSLGCVWFGGTQEGVADIRIWFSRRGAAGWSAPVALSDDAERSEQNPILFPAPDGTLWLLHTAQRSGHQDTAIVRCRQSTDGGTTWSAPRALLPEPGVFVRQPLVVAASGAWLLPVFYCRARPGERWNGDDDDSAVLVSRDQGRSWHAVPVPGSIGCVHMGIVPGRQAGTLLGFFRSRWADFVYRSVSTDDGASWSVPQPTAVPNNNSSIQVTRLASGRLAMACNPVGASAATARRVSLYDEIEGEDGGAAFAAPPAGSRSAFWGTPRAPMAVLLSDNEGLTWPHARNVETGDGHCMSNSSVDRRNREMSYPSLVQTSDARLHLAYTHHRQRIRHVALDESWILHA